MPDSTGTIVTIEELTGPDKRKLTLRGRGLPYKPIDFEGEHRITESGYAGSPSKSQQALGSSESDSEWKGAWHTKFLADSDDGGAPDASFGHSGDTTADPYEIVIKSGSANALKTAADIAELVDDIRRKGQVCRVTWLHLVRVGRLAKFRLSWTTGDDVEYTLTWKWIGRDESPPAPTPSTSSASSMASELSSGFTDLYNDTAFDDLADLDPNAGDLIDSRVGNLQRGILDLQGAIANTVASVTRPIAALRHAASLASFVALESQALIDQVGTMVAAAMVLPKFASVSKSLRQAGGTLFDATTSPISSVLNLGGLGVGTLAPVERTDLTAVPAGRAIAAGCAAQRTIARARALKHSAARQKIAALRQLDANAIATVVLKQNEDLADISRLYYGTPDDAEAIRAYNHLDSYAPPQGTFVIVPAQAART